MLSRPLGVSCIILNLARQHVRIMRIFFEGKLGADALSLREEAWWVIHRFINQYTVPLMMLFGT